MSKYVNFDNDCRQHNIKLREMLTRANSCDDNRRFAITKMPKPYCKSPHGRMKEFSTKTKIVCDNSDLSLFLDQCKVMFVGDPRCGKTSLISRFTTSKFSHEYKPTLGADLKTEYFNVLDIDYSIQLWDVPGHESLEYTAQSYFKKSNVIVVVFDLTRPSTLINAMKWMREALNANSRSSPVRFLVGTKSDKLERKTLESLEAHAVLVAQELDFEYFSVSAKKGTEVNNLFRRFTALSFESSIQKLITPRDYEIKNNLSSEYRCEIFLSSILAFVSQQSQTFDNPRYTPLKFCFGSSSHMALCFMFFFLFICFQSWECSKKRRRKERNFGHG